MNLLPWRKKKKNEFSEYESKANHLFDQFFNTPFFSPMRSLTEDSWYPRLDVSEGKKHVTVKAEIPGMDAKDIDVSLEGRFLTVKGEKKQEKEDKGKSCHRIERHYGRFQRTVELPAEVSDADVDASYKKGVLRIVMKKVRESDSKTVKVKTA